MKRYHLDRWDDIRYMLAVARAGSFFAAAENLMTSQSTVSRRIQFFEHRLGTRLFDRRAHGLNLTPAGVELAKRAEAMESAALGIERHLTGIDDTLAGLVQISAPEGLLTHLLVPMLRDFRQEYPMIQVDLLSGSGAIDLAARQADVAIRMSYPAEPGVAVIRAGGLLFTLFAAPAYLEKHGIPQSLGELASHWIIDHKIHLDQIDTWRTIVTQHERISGRFDSSAGYVAALRAGYGIGLLPDFYRLVAPDLVPLNLDAGCRGTIYVLSHDETDQSARIRAVLDYLKARISRCHSDWFCD